MKTMPSTYHARVRLSLATPPLTRSASLAEHCGPSSATHFNKAASCHKITQLKKPTGTIKRARAGLRHKSGLMPCWHHCQTKRWQKPLLRQVSERWILDAAAALRQLRSPNQVPYPLGSIYPSPWSRTHATEQSILITSSSWLRTLC